MININADLSNVRLLAKDFKFKSQRQFSLVAKQTLNDQAFATMKNARNNTMPRMFNIRNKWVQSSVQVDKVPRVVNNIGLMEAKAGAKKKWQRNRGKDFLGLREQEFGTDISSPIIDTLASRNNSIKKKVAPSNRFNKLGEIPESGNGDTRIIAMLRHLDATNYKGAFYIKGGRKFKRGIYKFGGGKKKLHSENRKVRNIKMIKDLSENVARLKPKPWLKTATKKAVTQQTTIRFYKKNAAKIVMGIKRL